MNVQARPWTRWVVPVAVGIAFLVSSWLLVRRPPDLPVVEFVVPAGFVGAVCLVEQPGGREIAASDDVTSVELPESGVLAVASLGFLRPTHEERWRYADGAPIPQVPLHALLARAPGTLVAAPLGTDASTARVVVCTVVADVDAVTPWWRAWQRGEIRTRALASIDETDGRTPVTLGP